MKNLALLSLLGLGSALYASKNQSEDIQKIQKEAAPIAYRCVLDGRPRMLVVRLDEGVSLAYDSWKCLLFSAWQGKDGKSVDHTGPVYDGKHGNQPKLQASKIFKNGKAQFILNRDGKKVEGSKLQYKGYKLENKGTSFCLMLQVQLSDGRKIAIEERPSFKTGILSRSLKVAGLAKNESLQLNLPKAGSWQGIAANKTKVELGNGDHNLSCKINVEAKK